ncbi:glycerophosphodiester phosphodiesterase [Actinomadura rugatobispora]|uniref:glycerophosphodiester phosphodiesterase n=1 Tax=Actinomadura rugatobispora TaxID=1994 RepID=A0ABW1A601_9ACTN|nr:glycerophosphodiester phosphodiesterase [Actinomadura rugatobispora]
MAAGGTTRRIQRGRRRGVALLGAAAVLLPLLTVAAPATAAPAERGRAAPIVLGHRGASGYRPEHTLASYELAVQMGADYIEPDLVPTKDGQLVARHENEIGGTTDVGTRTEFAGRRTTKTIDGRPVTGWFTEDFTLAELMTLRAVERLPDVRQHNTLYNGRYQVPTLQEVVDLAKRLGREHRRRVGIFPETKHPTYFRSIGLPLENTLISTLKRNGLDHRDGRAIVQSFEPTSLRTLDKALSVPVLQALSTSGAPYDTVAGGQGPTYAEMVTPAGLKEISTYADWIGPEKTLVIPNKADGTIGTPTPLVKDAHAAGLKVSPYTFRNENQFLPADLRNGTAPGAYGQALKEYDLFYRTGIDGLFSDNPDTAIIARTEFLAR